MRELEEGVARLNDAGAPLLEAEDAQGCDSKGDALAHSKSSEKRGYSRRGATPAEKEADCASMWSAEADKYAIEQLEGGVPVSKLHEKLDEAGHKPLHTHAKFTVRIVAQRYGHHKQKRGGRRFLHRKRTNVWTNLKDFEPKLCDKKCPGFVDGKHIQKDNCLGGGSCSNVMGNRAIRSKVPEPLIRDLFNGAIREHKYFENLR